MAIAATPAAAVHGSQRGWKCRPKHFARGAAHDAGADQVAVFGERAQQGAIADDVDESRHATREPLDFPQGAIGEYFARGAGDAQAMAHIGRGLVARQRIEVVTPGDALRELAQLDAA